MSTGRCECLTKKGDQCSKNGSKKAGDNPKFCWQHQKCTTPMTTVAATKKTPTPKKKSPTPKKKSPTPKRVKSPPRSPCTVGMLVRLPQNSGVGSVQSCQGDQVVVINLATAVEQTFSSQEVVRVEGIDLGDQLDPELCEEGTTVYFLYNTWIVYGQVIECLDEELRIQVKTTSYEAVFKSPYEEAYLFLGQEADLPVNSDEMINQKQ